MLAALAFERRFSQGARVKVWRLKSGAQPPAWGVKSEALDGDAVAVAVDLVGEINTLLGVANDSSDFRTKSARLASAKRRLSELQSIAACHPAGRITRLDEVQAAIARIESDLMESRLRGDSKGMLWVFHAGLYLDTPLDELLYHGVVEPGPVSELSRFASGASRGGWRQLLPTLREMGYDVDDPPETVASDIGTIPACGGRFLGFLIVFRKIVESGNSFDQTEAALNVFSGHDDFTAEVFEKLGPAKRMMRRAGISTG
ncbi:MAG: hypothetical protein ABIQ08_16945 [Duganella sp.]